MHSKAPGDSGVKGLIGLHHLESLPGEEIRQLIGVVRIGARYEGVALYLPVAQPDSVSEESEKVRQPFLSPLGRGPESGHARREMPVGPLTEGVGGAVGPLDRDPHTASTTLLVGHPDGAHHAGP